MSIFRQAPSKLVEGAQGTVFNPGYQGPPGPPGPQGPQGPSGAGISASGSSTNSTPVILTPNTPLTFVANSCAFVTYSLTGKAVSGLKGYWSGMALITTDGSNVATVAMHTDTSLLSLPPNWDHALTVDASTHILQLSAHGGSSDNVNWQATLLYTEV